MTGIDATSRIHPTAVVAEGAIIGPECEVGPYVVIGPHVRLGRGNKVRSHAVIEGFTSLGDGNVVFQFASVGSIPQDLKYRGEASTLEIGDRNIIREYATLQPGTEGGGMRTSVGSDNLFMVHSHVGHDCIVGSRNVFANSVALAGHVTIGDGVIVGGISAVHQFCRVGDLALVGGGAMVTKDVAPFVTVQGDRARYAGMNRVGMQRAGMSSDDMERVLGFYRDLFSPRSGKTFRDRVEDLARAGEGDPLVAKILSFIRSSTRGIIIPSRRRAEGEE